MDVCMFENPQVISETLSYNGIQLHITKADMWSTKLRLQNNNWLFNRWQSLFEALKLQGPGLALDVGANYGVASFELFTKGFCDQVIMFEPLVENCTCIERSLSQVATNFKWELKNMGVSNYCGEAHFLFQEKMSGTSSIVDAEKSNRTVPVMTLDSGDFSQVKFIKIDTEGYELEAIQGAENLIKQQQPVIFWECNPHSDADVTKLARMFSELEKINYVCVNSSFHVIESTDHVQLCNLVSDTIAHSVKDLIAIPKDRLDSITHYSVDFETWHTIMFNKLGKHVNMINNLPFVACNTKDPIHTHVESKDITLVENQLHSPKRGSKAYLLTDGRIFWTYKFFVNYGYTDHTSINSDMFEFS